MMKKRESMSRFLWNIHHNESVLALHTPIVESLGSGDIDRYTLSNFITQELYFFNVFLHVLKFAAKCSDLVEELEEKNSVFKEWNLNSVKPFIETVKYRDFLLATAAKKVAAYTLSAMMPHLQLYAFIGKELQPVLDTDVWDHSGIKWIQYYSSESFEVSTLQAMVLLDNLCVHLVDEDLDIIQNLYHQAIEFELAFFNSHLRWQKAAFPRVFPLLKEDDPSNDYSLVFSGFELKCTVVDSSNSLAEIAIETALKSDQVVDESNAWEVLCKEYTEEYVQCVKSILSAKSEPTAKGKKKYAVVKKALEQLSNFEKMANTRLIESSVLKDLNLDVIKRAGEGLLLQDGCISFFQSMIKNENISASIHVLSSRWSKDFIELVYHSAGDLDDVNIIADVSTYKEFKDTGNIKLGSLVNKAEFFDDILQSNDSVLIVYIGESVGDLLCLLKADVGIVIDPSESLKKVGSQCGVSFVPLLLGVVQKQKEWSSSCNWTGGSDVLYTVSCWAEIESFIVGYTHSQWRINKFRKGPRKSFQDRYFV